MSEALAPNRAPLPEADYEETMPVSRGLRGVVESIVFYGIVGFGIGFPIIAGVFGELIF